MGLPVGEAVGLGVTTLELDTLVGASEGDRVGTSEGGAVGCLYVKVIKDTLEYHFLVEMRNSISSMQQK